MAVAAPDRINFEQPVGITGYGVHAINAPDLFYQFLLSFLVLFIAFFSQNLNYAHSNTTLVPCICIHLKLISCLDCLLSYLLPFKKAFVYDSNEYD